MEWLTSTLSEASAGGDLTAGSWDIWRHLHSHVRRLTLAVSWNTSMWPLHVVSLCELVWAGHGGWVPSKDPKRTKQKHMAYVTSVMLC